MPSSADIGESVPSQSHPISIRGTPGTNRKFQVSSHRLAGANRPVRYLVKLMEDHRDHVASSSQAIRAKCESFLDANPGLASRFAQSEPSPADCP